MPDVEPLPPAEQGNLFTRHIGPLPVWGWAASGIGLYLLYHYYTTGHFFGTGTAPSATSDVFPGSSVPTSGGGGSGGGKGGKGGKGGGAKKICHMSAPPGVKKKVKVCGKGHWMKLKGKWYWVEDVVKATKGMSSTALGASGNLGDFNVGNPPNLYMPSRSPAVQKGSVIWKVSKGKTGTKFATK